MTWIKKISEFNGSLKRYVDPSFDASVISSGIIDAARLPPSAGVVVASGDITSLTTDQQTAIITGTKVILASGAAYYYKGTGSKTSLASYIAESAVVAWSGVTSKPDAVTSVGALTPVANFIAYYTGAASAALTSLTAFGRSLMGLADASAARSLIACLPINNPTATGTLTAPAIRNTGGTANTLIKWDSDGDEVASGVSDDGTTAAINRATTNIGANGTESTSLVIKGTAGSTRSLQIEGDGVTRFILALPSEGTTELRSYSAAGALLDKPITWGNSATTDQITLNRNTKIVPLAGAGDRPALLDSTGQFKADPRAGVQTGSGSIAIDATTKRILRVTGSSSLQLGSPASCAEVKVTVMTAGTGDVAIVGEHQYCDTSPAYWYYAAASRTIAIGNFGSDGNYRSFTLECDGVHWYFKG